MRLKIGIFASWFSEAKVTIYTMVFFKTSNDTENAEENILTQINSNNEPFQIQNNSLSSHPFCVSPDCWHFAGDQDQSGPGGKVKHVFG
jgi:hypothetical protein